MPATHNPHAQSKEQLTSTGRLGMAIFLLSLSSLFAATIIGYIVVRVRAADIWRTADLPDLPSGLWLSTALLIVCSIVIHYGRVSIRKGNIGALKVSFLIALALGLGFLVNQTINWMQLINAQLPPTAKSLYSFTFYLLTGLHAAHVIGGVIQLIVVTVKTYRGAYSQEYHPGIIYTAMYWHFLDIVWLILFVVFLVST